VKARLVQNTKRSLSRSASHFSDPHHHTSETSAFSMKKTWPELTEAIFS